MASPSSTSAPLAARDVLRILREAQTRLRLSYLELAVFCGFSLPTTIRLVRDGEWPEHARCVRGAELCAQRVAVARTRAELGLPS
jgi:hypothetical protein